MSQDHNAQDPLEFVRGMWSSMGFSLPGMVTPTLDVDELDKRITDMKAVEGWLKMNLNMLQMSIQGLELQRAALSAVKAMSTRSDPDDAAPDSSANPFAAAAAMWPWNLMTPTEQPQADTAAPAAEAKTSSRSTRRKPAGDK
ncbi:PhaM family polyhydroxyalkanoate granule multifunctional regulatory protein [Thauera sp.]|uniref:PhaM family polyhydroxyalkanoate granule multifunctional regulatory protein n=1 Tax=Thauera sp. TaxID=1905334 RepID=UPI0039E4CD02